MLRKRPDQATGGGNCRRGCKKVDNAVDDERNCHQRRRAKSIMEQLEEGLSSDRREEVLRLGGAEEIDQNHGNSGRDTQ